MRRESILFFILLLLYIVVFFISIFWGQTSIHMWNMTPDQIMVVHYRIERFLVSSAVGIVLSCTALTLQTITRNYLVDSSLLGVNSGAVLGRIFSMFLHVGPSQLFSLMGSLLGLGATFALGSIGGSDILRLVVAGVVVNSVLSSGISLISLYLYTSASSVLSWTLGHIRIVTSEEWVAILVALILCLLLVSRSKKLDLLTLSREEAMTLGINYRQELTLLLTTSALAGSLVSSIFGVFSFIGVAAPNMARQFVSGGHLKMFFYSSLIGAELMAFSDVFARSIIPGLEVPTGLIVSFVGAVFYLYFFWRTPHDHLA